MFIDARIRQFLDKAEMSIVECRDPITSSTESPSAVNLTTSPNTSTNSISPVNRGNCENDLVDVVFILDTSTSVERGLTLLCN